jgi:hypothetical protein
MRLGEMAAFEVFEFFLSEKQNCGMLFECPSAPTGNRHGRAFPQVPSDSRFRAKPCGADELRRQLANSSPKYKGKFSRLARR